MKCKICNRPDVAEINRLLLSKAALRSGIISSLAKKINCHRSVLWRHRKRHLGMVMLRRAPKDAGGTLEEKTERLEREASRLQLLAENGLPKVQFDLALKSLNARIRLVELQGRLEGRLVGGKSGPPVDARNLAAALKAAKVEVEAEEDPEELEKARREFEDVVGREQA